jgi:hypothetical protein
LQGFKSSHEQVPRVPKHSKNISTTHPRQQIKIPQTLAPKI